MVFDSVNPGQLIGDTGISSADSSSADLLYGAMHQGASLVLVACRGDDHYHFAVSQAKPCRLFSVRLA